MKKKHFYAAVILLLFLAAGIKPTLATIYLSFEGWEDESGNDPGVGTWDSYTNTGTLTQNVFETIEIKGDGITLDGGGHKVTPSRPDAGVHLYERLGVTIKNLKVTGGGSGIHIGISNNCIVTNNTVSTCDYGIWLAGSSNNTVTNNTVESSSEAGIWLQEGFQGPLWVGSDYNTLTGNNVTGVSVTQGNGIYIQDCSYNTLTSNTVSNNKFGIKLWNCDNISIGSQTTTNNISNNHWGIHLYNSNNNNALTGNNISDNVGGIWLEASSENTLTDNTVSSNGCGIYIRGQSDYNTLTDNTVSNNNYGIKLTYDPEDNTIYPNDNTIYHNNFIDNTVQAYVSDGCTGNVFNRDVPIGGNYWSNWCPPEHPDDDGDDFVDEPYLFNVDSQDNLPWAAENGWEIEPPEPAEPAEAIEPIIAVLRDIDVLEHMSVPDDAEKEMNKAVKELNKAIDEFNKDRIDKALKKITKAIKQLKKAQKKGVKTQDVISDLNDLVDLVQGL